MDILEVFIWYCKSKGIMPIIVKMCSDSNGFKSCRYDLNARAYVYSKEKLRNVIMTAIKHYDMKSVFWFIVANWNRFNEEDLLAYDDFVKAYRDWSRFVKNNLLLDPSYLKEGDKIMYFDCMCTFKGLNHEGKLIIKRGLDILLVSPYASDDMIKIIKTINGNDVEIENEPKFLIKKNRKIYGLNKR